MKLVIKSFEASKFENILIFVVSEGMMAGMLVKKVNGLALNLKISELISRVIQIEFFAFD